MARSQREHRKGGGVEHLRAPPQSIEAEQAVLGGLMLDPTAIMRVGVLDDRDFFRRDHQLIFRAFRELAEKGQPTDAVTMGEWFESHGLAEQVAGGAYLIELASGTPSAANIRAYADIVRDKAKLRQLIEVGTKLVNDGFQPEGRESSDILAEAMLSLDGTRESGDIPAGLRSVPLEDFIHTPPDTIRYAVYPIIPRGVVTLWGGHGGAGKSVSILQVAALGACNMEMEGLLPEGALRTVYFSLEDQGSLALLRLRRITESYYLNANAVEHNLRVFDCPGGKAALMNEVSTFGVRQMIETPLLAQIRRQCEGADLVIIDNASDAFGGNENDRQAVRTFMTAMGRIARETNAGVVVLAHVDKAGARNGANGNTYSGSTAWHNSARSRVAVVKDDKQEGCVLLVHEKNNLGKIAPQVTLKWNDHGVLVPLTALDRKEVRGQGDTDLAMHVLLAAKEQGIHVYCATAGSTPGHKVVAHLPAYADHFGTDRFNGSKKFHRALIDLQEAGRIVKHSVKSAHRHAVDAWSIVSSGALNGALNPAANAPNDFIAPPYKAPERGLYMGGDGNYGEELSANKAHSAQGSQDEGECS